MKKKITMLLFMGTMLIGCSNVGSNTIGSTTVGAGAGALLGQAIGHDSKATLLGAGIGAAAGALVGSVQDQTQAIENNNRSTPNYYNNQPQYTPYYNSQYATPRSGY
ncbi:glycine zipper 2TM domain-containing protein [Cetobacterium sp. 2A]|uniref:YMGG-like glycine zipper-containing protein n=1 Tax=unclassified Cetobacterium TaxID=2630983 RepID=UPI00163B6657|nr:YMGG-like glycine zipper-containing protein [Cetobacterium sp. 2A]MBC2855528.1 glycine zipper 2TM domain-containing protein [Cetobacterium sp. 2A]